MPRASALAALALSSVLAGVGPARAAAAEAAYPSPWALGDAAWAQLQVQEREAHERENPGDLLIIEGFPARRVTGVTCRRSQPGSPDVVCKLTIVWRDGSRDRLGATMTASDEGWRATSARLVRHRSAWFGWLP